MSGFIRNSVLGMVAGVATLLTNFIAGLIVARMLGAGGLGMFAFAGWAASIIMIGVSLGLPFTLTRFLPELLEQKGLSSARILASKLAWPVLAATALVLAIATLWAVFDRFVLHETYEDIAGRNLFHDPVLCLLVAICASSQALAEYARCYLKGIHQFSRVAFITLTSAGLQILAIAAGGHFLGIRGAIAGSIAGTIYPIWIFRDFLGKRETKPNRPNDTRATSTAQASSAAAQNPLGVRIWRYAKFRWGSELLNFFVWSRIEVFFLLIFWNAQSVGLFTTSLVLANLAQQGPLMLTGSVLPHLSRKLSRNDFAAVHKTYMTGTRLMAFMACPLCIGLAAIMPRVVPLLYGNAFSDAVPSAIILVLAASLTAPTSIGSNLLLAAEHNDVDFYLGILGAILSGLGAIFLIKPYGILGAAASRAATQIICVILSSCFLKRYLKVEIPLTSFGKILSSGALCASAAYAVLQFVPGISGVVTAVTVAAIVYAVAIRFSGALELEDIVHLSEALKILPRPLSVPSRRCLVFLDRRVISALS